MPHLWHTFQAMDKQYVMEGVILIDDIVVLGCLKGYCAMYQMCQMLTIQ